MEEKVKARIVINDKIRHGKPIIKGTRITVDEVLGALIGGMNYEEIEREYGVMHSLTYRFRISDFGSAIEK